MNATPLELRLLSVYRQAIRQQNWVVADHLLSAIEACGPADGTMSDIVIVAYGDLAAGATASLRAQLKGSNPDA